MDGITGQNILAENGITLNEDHIVLEGEQAEEYKARKAAEKKKNDEDNEQKYQKRFGGRTTTTTLRGNDRNPGTWDRVKSGAVDHTRVKYSKMPAKDKQNHFDKHSKEFENAHIATAKELNKRQFEHNWGNTDKALDDTYGNIAYTADGIARHNRRHPKQYIESTNIFRYADLVSE